MVAASHPRKPRSWWMQVHSGQSRCYLNFAQGSRLWNRCNQSFALPQMSYHSPYRDSEGML
ncbi:hypothetical protein DsansV1_C06g0063041 [Dioscorea sansibarensis]